MLEEQRRRLDNEPWEEHIERLTLYAQRLIKSLNWQNASFGNTLGGKEAKDLVHDAISDVYLGKRVWNRSTHPELIRFLFSAVKSEVYNAAVSKANTETAYEPERDPRFNEQFQSRSDDDVLVLEILDYVQNEPDLYAYVEAIALYGCESRSDVAQYLRIETGAVDNMRKRMRRRLEDFHASYRPLVMKETNNHGK